MENFNKWVSTTPGRENDDEAKKVRQSLLDKLSSEEEKRAKEVQKQHEKKLEENNILMGVKAESERASSVSQSLQDVKIDFENSLSNLEQLNGFVSGICENSSDLTAEDKIIEECWKSNDEFEKCLENANEYLNSIREKHDISKVFSKIISEKDQLKSRLAVTESKHSKFIGVRNDLKINKTKNIMKLKKNEELFDKTQFLKDGHSKLETENGDLNEKLVDKRAALVALEFTEARIGHDSEFEEKNKKLEEKKSSSESMNEDLKRKNESVNQDLINSKQTLKKAMENLKGTDLVIEESGKKLIEKKYLQIRNILERKKKEAKNSSVSSLQKSREIEKNSISDCRKQICQARTHGTKEFKSIKEHEAAISKRIRAIERLNNQKSVLENKKLRIETDFKGIISFEKEDRSGTSGLDESGMSSFDDNQSVRTDLSLTPQKPVVATRAVSTASIDPFDPFIRAAPMLTSTPIANSTRRNPVVDVIPKKRGGGRGRGTRGGKRGK
ncbi:unnamed protein product [Caenorhabditis angaria]|uniref:Uncharacterized protein n=1 Tax=Caenorhabditis angaria TaxID=860376 RepID=A0A9P1I523_9PELO|nr:unnamed protein product [Caenorhabditis angaria]